ncbi:MULTISPECIES: hypothetical protein [Mumia]|uniref:hypothetical protein n=1 Tax=Mumia TaxID=1546255 RepID=UPI001FBBA28D|nr:MULTISPECIES: hypothetical protein [unclassified Mumia]
MPHRPALRPLLAAAAASLMLAGCGSTFPGDAVVVGSSTLSMDRFDTLADAGCTYLATVATSQGGQAPAQGQVRQVIATQQLQLAGARKVADDRGIEVPPSQYALQPADLEQLETMFGGDQFDDIVEILERDFESQALRTAIGADDTGTAPTQENAEQLMGAGTEVVSEELVRVDAAVDPRFGISNDGQPDPALQLSVSREQLDQIDPTTLPANQQCRGVESSE